MGSCAAPSAKGDDKFITTDYLQQCPVQHPRGECRRPRFHLCA
ncbi:recombinase family protein, partial [Salmonella enterica]|nr:recombinase family protein [Salmonella enterica]